MPRMMNAAIQRKRALLRPGTDDDGRAAITPEMREIAEALAHPDGDLTSTAGDLAFTASNAVRP